MWLPHQSGLKQCDILHARSCRNTSILHLLQRLFHTTSWITHTSSWQNQPTPHSLWNRYSICVSYVLPSLHEKDQVNFNSAPSQITIQQPTPIPTLPTFPHHPSNSARGDWNSSSAQSLSWSPLVFYHVLSVPCFEIRRESASLNLPKPLHESLFRFA